MTSRKRIADENVENKVYRSNRVPQQARFPHRKKIVRRTVAPANDVQHKRQMKFLPDKMRAKVLKVEDSEYETESDLDVSRSTREESNEDVNQDEKSNTKTVGGGSARKRHHDVIHIKEEYDEEEPYSKRPRRQRQKPPNLAQHEESEPEDYTSDTPTSASKRRATSSARSIRQSTMTQFVDGRRPLSEDEEPIFKRASRVRISKQSQPRKRDQRTLTQMVPGLRQIKSSEEEDEDETDNEVDYDAVGRRAGLAQPLERPATIAQPVQGDFQDGEVDDNDVHQASDQRPANRPRSLEYKSTSPSPRGRLHLELRLTPKKYRGHIVPSSQSPESSLSSPPLASSQSQSRDTVCNILRTEDALSKRKRKDVAFGPVVKERSPIPPLRKFRSVIQDSEDEDDDLSDDYSPSRTEANNLYMRKQTDNEDVNLGKPVGSETQAMLVQIDQACAVADKEKGPSNVAELSGGRASKAGRRQARNEHIQTENQVQTHTSGYIKSEPVSTDDDAEGAPAQGPSHHMQQHERDFRSMPAKTELCSSPPLMHPSEYQMSSTATRLTDEVCMESSDRDVGCSDSSRPSTSQSNPPSQSNIAEQQIQHEWSAYSQNIYARPTQMSSASKRTDQATQAITVAAPNSILLPQSPHHPYSQATTVDEVTPKKNRVMGRVSVNTTPRHGTGIQSQPFVSPVKPPPLFIPSSFPSPAKARVSQWGSPVHDQSQAVYGDQFSESVEDFSIPPPPPDESSPVERQ